jgi:hypothetical protein
MFIRRTCACGPELPLHKPKLRGPTRDGASQVRDRRNIFGLDAETHSGAPAPKSIRPDVSLRENNMKMNFVSGGSIAVAAVALALNGVAMTTGAHAATKTVMCAGINSCKGMGACKSASNACKGQNSCKGEGWLPEKSKSACLKKGGKVLG